MGQSREAVTAFILEGLEAILPGNSDTPRYKAYLEGLSNAAFKQYMEDIKAGNKWLTITAPNLGKTTLSLERNKKVAEKLGISFFHKLWIEGDEDTPTYLTPIEYLVVKLPFRLAAQRLEKKKSIPKTQRIINSLTGQPTGASKGASISYPELRVCAAMGLESSMVELMKFRGGDARGGAALSASLMRTGRATQETLEHFASGVQSTSTLKTYLIAAGLKNTL